MSLGSKRGCATGRCALRVGAGSLISTVLALGDAGQWTLYRAPVIALRVALR